MADCYAQRTVTPTVMFLPALLLTGLSFAAGGVPVMTDAGMIALTAAAMIWVIQELRVFHQRFGIGGVTAGMGVLIWFCQDYLDNWLGRDFTAIGVKYGPDVIARAAFFHCIFVVMMCLGLIITVPRRVQRFFVAFPEPSSPQFYLIMLLALFAIGLLPYLIFTRGGFFESIYLEMTSGRGARGARWTVGRTGNLNYNWGGYVAEMLKVGEFGGMFAAIFFVLIARNPVEKALAFSIWFFWLAMGYGSGTRTKVVAMAMPMLVCLFIKYHAIAARFMGRGRIKAYFYVSIVALIPFFMVQVQGQFRNRNLRTVSFSEVEVTKVRGNTMFSEALDFYSKIPQEMPFFYNSVPGEGAIRALPQTVFFFLIHPIPRAGWRSKPVDQAWASRALTDAYGRKNQGTTVSAGIVGYWYFRYGMAGLLQGGLLVGWLFAVFERCLQNAGGRPMTITIALVYCGVLFLMFRDMYFIDVWSWNIALFCLYLLVKIQRLINPAGA